MSHVEPNWIGHLNLDDRVMEFQTFEGEVVFQAYLPNGYDPEQDQGRWALDQFLVWLNENDVE